MGGDEREAAEYAPEENPDYEAFVLVRAFLDELPAHGDAIAGYSRNGLRHALTEPMLRALVAGYEKLRTERSAVLARGAELEAENARMRKELERPRREQPGRGYLANAYANGWADAIAAYRPPGWDAREAAWRKHREAIATALDARDATPQQPVRDTADGAE